jgi:hypothetical protein
MRVTLPHSDVGGVQTGAWIWVLAAGTLGAATSAIVTGVLGWSRDRFVAVHAAAVLALALGYVRWSGIGAGGQLRRRWKAGLAGGLIIGGLLAQRVLSSPGAPGPEDPALAAHLVWLGLVYGLVDAGAPLAQTARRSAGTRREDAPNSQATSSSTEAI